MAVLNSVFAFLGISQAVTPMVAEPGGMWQKLILGAFAFVVDYGWRIVVFTVLLKLVISPLDFYQRYKMNKNQKIATRLAPTMAKVQKQYGNDKQAFSQKQMELYRKEGYSYFSACLPMIVTLVVFLTLWSGMRNIAQYMMFKEYTTLYDEYTYVTEQIFDPVDPDHLTQEEADKLYASIKIGQEVVYQLYYYGLDESFTQTLKQNAEYAAALPEGFKLLRDGVALDKVQSSFLWIKNIWAPDVPWGNQAILSYNTFISGIGNYSKASKSGLDAEYHDKLIGDEGAKYNEVMSKLLNDETQSRTNGYLILPILVVVLSFSAQLLSMLQQKKAGQTNAQGGMAGSMKFMMVLMPIMMAVFAIQSASIFSLYMVTNSAVTLFFNFLFTGIIRLIDKIKDKRKYGISEGSTRGTVAASGDPNIIHYVKGANPNAGAREVAIEDKKVKKPEQRTVVRSGRPDPNDLINMNMSSDRDKRKK